MLFSRFLLMYFIYVYMYICVHYIHACVLHTCTCVYLIGRTSFDWSLSDFKPSHQENSYRNGQPIDVPTDKGSHNQCDLLTCRLTGLTTFEGKHRCRRRRRRCLRLRRRRSLVLLPLRSSIDRSIDRLTRWITFFLSSAYIFFLFFSFTVFSIFFVC